jgi:hypothetical protein
MFVEGKRILVAYADIKNSVFGDITPCDSGKNRRFGESQLLRNQDENN